MAVRPIPRIWEVASGLWGTRRLLVVSQSEWEWKLPVRLSGLFFDAAKWIVLGEIVQVARWPG